MGLRSREETESLEEQYRKILRVDGVNWMLSSTLNLSHHLRQYNNACEPPPWPERDPREIDQWLAICAFLNSLIEFRYNAYKFVNTDWGEEFPELVELVRPILRWSDGVAKDFITSSLESRIREAMSVDAEYDVLEELTCAIEPCFRVRPHPNAGIDVVYVCMGHIEHRIDAFPELEFGVSEFEVIAETLLLNSLHALISLNGDIASLLGDRDSNGISADVPTDLHSIGAESQLVLNALQIQILKVLKGKGLRTEALASACGVDKSKFYRKSASGIKPLEELKDAGLVTKDGRIGYYRPDAPPPGVIRVNRGAQ